MGVVVSPEYSEYSEYSAYSAYSATTTVVWWRANVVHSGKEIWARSPYPVSCERGGSCEFRNPNLLSSLRPQKAESGGCP